MAKVKGTYVTNLSGRVGNVVYRNVQGENIASQRPASVLNPKTGDQAIQRCLFNTCIIADSILYDVTDHSTQNLSGKRKNLSSFMSENLKAMRNELSLTARYYLPKNGKGLTGFPFLISKGSLPTVDTTPVNEKQTREDEGSLIAQVKIQDYDYWTQYATDNPDITFTLIAILNTGDGEDELGNHYPTGYSFKYVQFRVIEGQYIDVGSLNDYTKSGQIEIINGSDSDWFVSEDDVSGTSDTGKYGFMLESSTKYAFISYAMILSKKTDNGWEYSTSKMCPVFSNIVDDNYTFTLRQAALSMGVSEDYLLNNPSAMVDGELVFG